MSELKVVQSLYLVALSAQLLLSKTDPPFSLQAAMSSRGNETGRCEWHGPACLNALSDAFCQSNTWFCCRFQPCQGLCRRACDRCLWW